MNQRKITRSNKAPSAGRLSAFGRKVFGIRLYVGLAITAVGLEALTPKPFLAAGLRGIQVVAMALIAGGLGLRAWAAGCAGGHTRSKQIEAPRLATNGPFAYLRNPIYGGTMCLGFGMVLLIGDPLGFIFAGIAFIILYVAIVPAEEAFLLKAFGDEYSLYKSAVPRFIPRLRAWNGRVKGAFNWRSLLGEIGIAILLLFIYLALWFEEYLDKVWG